MSMQNSKSKAYLKHAGELQWMQEGHKYNSCKNNTQARANVEKILGPLQNISQYIFIFIKWDVKIV